MKKEKKSIKLHPVGRQLLLLLYLLQLLVVLKSIAKTVYTVREADNKVKQEQDVQILTCSAYPQFNNIEVHSVVEQSLNYDNVEYYREVSVVNGSQIATAIVKETGDQIQFSYDECILVRENK